MVSTVRAEQTSNNFKSLPPSTSTRLSLADILLLLCVIIWAFNVPLVKLALDYINPLGLSLIRFSSAGLLLFFIARYREKSIAIRMKDLPAVMLCAFLGIALNQVFFVYALKNSTSSEVSLLMASTPTFATLIAWLTNQETIGWNFWKSLPVAIAGICLIIFTAQTAHFTGGWLGDLLALATAASWAAYTVIIRPLLKSYSISKLTAYITLIGAFMILPFGGEQLNLDVLTKLPGQVWLAVGYSTLASVVLTNFLWYFGVKQLGGPRTAFYSYLQPFVGVLAAALILNESIVIWQLAGGALVIVSMLIYRRKPTRYLEKNKSINQTGQLNNDGNENEIKTGSL